MAVGENKYAVSKRERKECADAVIQSSAKRKIVVAGPGTGKTYLFKKILEGKKNTLTLTFVNALVEDLSLELCGLSDVKTLHSYAYGVVREAGKSQNKRIKVFPKLSAVIKEDARILLNQDVDFEHLFHNRDDENEYLEFYKRRKDLYGHYGFSDIVFAPVKYFEEKKDEIPVYEQVVVDEFQDFNRLEVSLIDLLAEKSPVLLAGDDDQALYESLKSASPKHIRQRHDEGSAYATFCLPYCSRCSRVIVETANDIITGATNNGYLTSRINKSFKYFDDEEKDKVGDQNPEIIYSQLFATQIPWFIQQQIEKIAQEVKGKFRVLIISPTKTQCRMIVHALKEKGFEGAHFVDKKNTEEATLLDGLKHLLKHQSCNLGWRVVAQNVLENTQFEALLKESAKDDKKRFGDLIPADQKKSVRKMLTTLRAVRDGKPTNDENELDRLFKELCVDACGMAKDFLKDDIKSCKPTANRPVAQKLEKSLLR